MVDADYVEDYPEEAKAEARERAEAEAAVRPVPTFMELLAELAKEFEPDMEGVCTADQLLSGIDTPRELSFEEFNVFVRDCLNDLKNHTTFSGGHVYDLTPMGNLRANRFVDWLITLEIERQIVAFQNCIGVYRIHLSDDKVPAVKTLQSSMGAYMPWEKYPEDNIRRNTSIADIIEQGL